MVWSLNVLYWCFLQCSVVMARVVLFFCLQDVHCVVKHSTMFTVASTAKKTIWWSAVPLIIHWFNRQCWEYQWIHDTFLVQYQYHWYILGCISIINHWYMTVIHLLKANHSLFWNWRLLLTLLFYVWCKLYVRLVVLLCMYFCVFWQYLSLASNLGLAEVFKSVSKVSRITMLLKCISIMIQFRSIIPNTDYWDYLVISKELVVLSTCHQLPRTNSLPSFVHCTSICCAYPVCPQSTSSHLVLTEILLYFKAKVSYLVFQSTSV